MPSQRPRVQHPPAQRPPEYPRRTAGDPPDTTQLPTQSDPKDQPRAWSATPGRDESVAGPAPATEVANSKPQHRLSVARDDRRTRARPPQPPPQRDDPAVVVAAIVMVLLAAGVFIGLLAL